MCCILTSEEGLCTQESEEVEISSREKGKSRETDEEGTRTFRTCMGQHPKVWTRRDLALWLDNGGEDPHKSGFSALHPSRSQIYLDLLSKSSYEECLWLFQGSCLCVCIQFRGQGISRIKKGIVIGRYKRHLCHGLYNGQSVQVWTISG